MDLSYYEDLPDNLPIEEISKYCIDILASSEPSEIVLPKLDELSDRQWHSYQLPTVELQSMLQQWIIQNWDGNQIYLEWVLGICYCFGLEKELYKRAFTLYQGEHFLEFEAHLIKSSGNNIDPWWSMRKNDS